MSIARPLVSQSLSHVFYVNANPGISDDFVGILNTICKHVYYQEISNTLLFLFYFCGGWFRYFKIELLPTYEQYNEQCVGASSFKLMNEVLYLCS